MEYGQPGAAIPHETFAEVSSCTWERQLVAKLSLARKSVPEPSLGTRQRRRDALRFPALRSFCILNFSPFPFFPISPFRPLINSPALKPTPPINPPTPEEYRGGRFARGRLALALFHRFRAPPLQQAGHLLLEGLQVEVENRGDIQGQELGKQEAAHHRHPQGPPGFGPGPEPQGDGQRPHEGRP